MKNKMSEITKEHPLILVCYIDRETLNDRMLMSEISKGINTAIAQREANIMAFFVPTDDNERIECINPKLSTEEQTERINKMIEEISKQFDINQEL